MKIRLHFMCAIKVRFTHTENGSDASCSGWLSHIAWLVGRRSVRPSSWAIEKKCAREPTPKRKTKDNFCPCNFIVRLTTVPLFFSPWNRSSAICTQYALANVLHIAREWCYASWPFFFRLCETNSPFPSGRPLCLIFVSLLSVSIISVMNEKKTTTDPKFIFSFFSFL